MSQDSGKSKRPPGQNGAFTYGPVPSRRLGYSLGVDILPAKTCSFDCIYCQLGKTSQKSVRRRHFFLRRQILTEVKEALARDQRIDHITFSGSGEPTLNMEIGRLIRGIKKITSVPVAVLTNSSLLTRKSVRRALLAADIVVPSLDAATAAAFRRVNRPLPSLKVEEVIRGLAAFRREFRGQVWLEVMLVKGMNDSRADIEALRTAIARIGPDRVQLNTVVRPPAEPWAKPLSRAGLEKIRRRLGGKTEVIVPSGEKQPPQPVENPKEAILSMLARRPMTAAEIAECLGRSERAIQPDLEALLRWRRIIPREHKGKVYYEPKKNNGRD
ncbi:MAG: radical SAM protein [Acidobacteriota bacterium]